MNSNLDKMNELFSNVDGLTWYPWIGSEFDSNHKNGRILLVGESHYSKNSPEEIAKANSSDFTQKVVQEMGIDNFDYSSRFFNNLHSFFDVGEAEKRKRFWNSIAFMNFVQRPMIKDDKIGRPIKSDFRDGWPVLFSVLEVLKPKKVLFIGNTAADTLQMSMKNSLVNLDGVYRDSKIGKYVPKRASLSSQDLPKTQLLFIKHVSTFFSANKWHEYLQPYLKEEFDFFKS